MQMDADENRFCVLKIPKIEGQVDPFLLQKMRDEYPPFYTFFKNELCFTRLVLAVSALVLMLSHCSISKNC